MLAKLLMAAVVAALLSAPAQAQGPPVLLMPGVTYQRDVQFTSHGPVAVHVIEAPRPGGLWSLEPVLSNGALVAGERVTATQRDVAREATAAGVNGDLSLPDGRPAGLLLRSGVLDNAPAPRRSSIGIGAGGRLQVARVQLFARWWGKGQRRPVDLNRPPDPNGVSLFTPAWGMTTPPGSGVVEAVIDSFPPTRAGAELTGNVVRIAQTDGGTPIPRGGAVLVGRGAGAGFVAEDAPAGAAVTVRLLLAPDWSRLRHALGGGPVLVRAGKPVFRHGELFPPLHLGRNARSAVGQRRNGRILLVVVDGGQPGYSTGVTSFELAQTLARLGAVTAAGLDAGASATMAFDGELLNRPATPAGELPVSGGLFVLYRGVYVAPPSERVLSPNGDGVSDVQAFSYRLPRPSTVAVTLVGPDRRPRRLDSGEKAAGVQRFSWQGATVAGRHEREGIWRLSVVAVDEERRRSRAERTFVLNRTLGSLAVAARGRRARATFVLARAARVSGRIETRAGAVVAVVGGKRLARGRRMLAWDGRIAGRRAHRGAYVFRVVAENRLGPVDLAQPFSLR